jgi:hypothetical protein
MTIINSSCEGGFAIGGFIGIENSKGRWPKGGNREQSPPTMQEKAYTKGAGLGRNSEVGTL